MPERPSRKENAHSLWIPFRSRNPTSTHTQEYGLISWQPVFIPEGQKLSIDVMGANDLLRLSRIGFPIEIRPNNQRDQEEIGATYNMNGFTNMASATLEKIVARSRNPQPTGGFVYDQMGNRGLILINFNKIGDQVAERLPQRRDDPQYAKYYGLMVDKALKSQLGRAAIVNYLIQYPNENIFAGENERVFWGLIPAAPAALFGLLELALDFDPVDAARNFTIALGSLEAIWLLKGVSNAARFDDYGEYLRDKLLHGSAEERLKEIYPHNFMLNFLIPFGVNALWEKKLVKGIS